MTFKREQRYLVIKIKDAEKYLDFDQQMALRSMLDEISTWRETDGKEQVDTVCVDSDWPEYEVVWKMIEDRVTRRSTHNSEPSYDEFGLPNPTTYPPLPAKSKAKFWADNLQPGETYVGLILGTDGAPDHHLVLLPGETKATWPKAKVWAKAQGGELPSRREQSLLFANCKGEFKADWYWSGEAYGDGKTYAWSQGFSFGYQFNYHHYYELPARAVRRLII